MFYSSITLFINDQIRWNETNHFKADYVSGLCVAGFMLLKDSCNFVIDGKQIISKIEDINKLSNMGGFISERNKTTEEALECSMADEGINCDFRVLQPDDGTTAAWIFDHNEIDGSRWNLIMMDNPKEFIYGFNFMCNLLGAKMWNYILGQPLESEGGVANWKLLNESDL